MKRPCAWLLAVGMAGAAWAGESPPVELGKVAWLRDYDQAVQQAKQENKPILILFQEVPG